MRAQGVLEIWFHENGRLLLTPLSNKVLFEGENKEGYIHGFTENYVKVKTPWNPELVNTLHEVELTKIDEDGLVRFDFVNAFSL